MQEILCKKNERQHMPGSMQVRGVQVYEQLLLAPRLPAFVRVSGERRRYLRPPVP